MTSADQPAGPFGALHHIGIAVRSFEPARATICALLGGAVADQGEDDILAARWLFIEAPGTVPIELVTPTHDDGPIARYLAKRGEGIHHVSFHTDADSLDASHDHVAGCGLAILGENRDHGGAEELFVHPRLTGGALLHSFRLPH
jgi:methylmalonyl-CoA/ethylmalonyl-CoA epimerase